MEDGPAASEAMGEGQGVSAGDWPASSEGCPRTEGLDDGVQAEGGGMGHRYMAAFREQGPCRGRVVGEWWESGGMRGAVVGRDGICKYTQRRRVEVWRRV